MDLSFPRQSRFWYMLLHMRHAIAVRAGKQSSYSNPCGQRQLSATVVQYALLRQLVSHAPNAVLSSFAAVITPAYNSQPASLWSQYHLQLVFKHAFCLCLQHSLRSGRAQYSYTGSQLPYCILRFQSEHVL